MTAYSFLHKIFSWFVQGVFWCTIIGFSLLSADVSEQDSVTPIPETETKSAAEPYFPWEMGTVAVRQNSIDDIVLPLLASVTKRPLYLCSDEVFLRRAFLDIGGTIPNPVQIRRFLKEKNPRKREILIDMLLSSEAHIDYLSMKWCDLLRIKSEFPVRLWPNAVQAYYRWIRSAVKTNMSYDVFVRAQICASGSNFRDPPVNFLRAVENKEPVQIAAAVMLTFLGVRIEKWPAEKKNGAAAFFSQTGYKGTSEWKEEIVFFNRFAKPFMGQDGTPVRPMYPDGKNVFIPAGADPRVVFSEWLINEENPWFARNLVNRVWSWIFGRGIIHPADDIRPDNPPANPVLLSLLEKNFIQSNWDIRELYRFIMNSAAYQLTSVYDPSEVAASPSAGFARYTIRRLEAEVIIDIINSICGSSEQYMSMIPEPFTFIPPNQRSITLADGSITSAFLELFGRPPRGSGYENERNNESTAAQRLHLLNSSHIRDKFERGWKVRGYLRERDRKKPQVSGSDAFEELFLLTVGRFPSGKEQRTIAQAMDSEHYTPAAAAGDVLWALVNSAEFLYRH